MRLSKIFIAILLAVLCVGLSGAQTWTSGLSFPSFTDTTDPNGWRSWICIANPYDAPVDYELTIWDHNGVFLGGISGQLPASGSFFIRPRNIVGRDCVGSAAVVSNIPITGILEKTRKNNQMTNSYSADRLDYEVITSSRGITQKMTLGNKAASS